MADAIGSTKGHLSNVEAGKRDMMPAVAEALAKVFDISVETLLRHQPGEEVDLEQTLIALFRRGTVDQKRAILDAAGIVMRFGAPIAPD